MDERSAAPRWLPLLLIALASLGLRIFVVARTEVPARDAVGYIRTACAFETHSFTEVIRTTEQNPGYALAVMLVNKPVVALRGVSAESLAFTAQLTSVLFAALAVFPVAWLGRELFGRAVGVVAAALLQCLPVWVKITSDGLSESAFLFWAASACWLGARAVRTGRPWSFLPCGLLCGLAYWTRPEGAEVALAFAAVPLGLAMARRQPWTTSALQATVLSLGLLSLVGLYVGINGRLTNKNTARVILGDDSVDPEGTWKHPVAAPTAELLSAFWTDPQANKLRWATTTLASETAQGFHYVVGALALVGSAFAFARTRNRGAVAALLTLGGLHTAILVQMMLKIGYLSDRHTLYFIICGLYPAALALTLLAGWLAPRFGRTTPTVLTTLVLLLFASGLPSLVKPLHGNRAGHRAAGVYIRQHWDANDQVLDPFGWAGYYAGREFRPLPPEVPSAIYVVLETSDNQHSRLPLIPEAKAKAALGEIVFRWPENKPAVFVARVPWGETGRK